MASFDTVVVLKGGTSVLLPPLQFAIELEMRGFTLTAHTDDRLEVQPVTKLTQADCLAIRHWKPELLRIARYTAPEIA